MSQYFFILGRNPELSLAELHAVLPSGYKVLACSAKALVAECAELKVEQLMKRLGGTIKIGVIAWKQGNMEIWKQIVFNFVPEQNKKNFLGLSAYPLDSKAHLPNIRELRELGIKVKRDWQAQGHKVRLVTSRERVLSSVIVKKEKLLTQGAELVLLYQSSRGLLGPIGPNRPQPCLPTFIGRTLAVQEFEQASTRDFGRPVREMKVGMLPIQLAKIMINLARAPLNATILDPFCGFGTVLAEAWLMSYRHLIGSDMEQKMVDATRKNLEWLRRNVQCPIFNFQSNPNDQISKLELKLFQSPVEELAKHLSLQSVDAIVTEPYLGPIRGIRNYESGIMNQLANLYITAFGQFAKILKPGGRVVFILPAFKHGTTLTKTSTAVLPKIKPVGFTPMPLLPPHDSCFMIHASRSITYSRPSQHVLREIFVLEFKPQT